MTLEKRTKKKKRVITILKKKVPQKERFVYFMYKLVLMKMKAFKLIVKNAVCQAQ